MTPEEAGERAAAEAWSWMGSVLSREPKPGTAEERSWGPGNWPVTVTVMAPTMKEGHKARWVVMTDRGYVKPEEAVKIVREHVGHAARSIVPFLKWACRAGFDPHELADAAVVREVLES